MREKAHKADQNEGTNIDDDPGLIGGTHVVKAHSADETAGANHGKTGVDLGNPGNPRFEAGNS